MQLLVESKHSCWRCENILTTSSATKPHPDSKPALGKPIQLYGKFCSKQKELFQQFQQPHQSSSLQTGYLSLHCLKMENKIYSAHGSSILNFLMGKISMTTT